MPATARQGLALIWSLRHESVAPRGAWSHPQPSRNVSLQLRNQIRAAWEPSRYSWFQCYLNQVLSAAPIPLPLPPGSPAAHAGLPATPESHLICQQLTPRVTALHISCAMSIRCLNSRQLVKFNVAAIYFGMLL